MLSEHCLGSRYLVEGKGKSHLFCCRVLSPLSIHVSAKNTKTKKKTVRFGLHALQFLTCRVFFFFPFFLQPILLLEVPAFTLISHTGRGFNWKLLHLEEVKKKKMKSAF